MELPIWVQHAIQQRLDHVTALLERHPELHQHRAEEKQAFDAMISGIDPERLPEWRAWEDKHQLLRAMENERVYVQGMKDGVQLVTALLSGSLLPRDETGGGSHESKTVASEDRSR